VKTYLFVGIDGGLKGGISGIDREGNIIFKMEMPVFSSYYNTSELLILFEDLKEKYNLKVMLEEVMIIPMASKKGFTNMKAIANMKEMFGLMKGILLALKISFEVVRAVTWQKVIFLGVCAKDTKEASMKWCTQKYPNEDFRKNERCRVLHDGITDSVCMANYCLMREKGVK
jgi:hypothetical protein